MHEPRPEERLALLLRELPPAPEAWAAAAAALPEVLSALDSIDERVLDDATERSAQTAALERALRDADVEPTPERLAALRVLARAHRS
jgi:hypothetical protein